MINSAKKIGLSALVIVIIFSTFLVPAKASALSFNPVDIINKATNLIVTKVSGLIYYLIKQKEYFIDGFSDPNVYPALDVPKNIEKILAPDTDKPISVKTPVVVSDSPISIATSTLPAVKKTSTKVAVTPEIKSVPSLPPLVIKNVDSDLDDNFDFTTILNYGRSGNSEILNLTNQERVSVGLNPLSDNVNLDKIASLRADDLFANQYFDHISPNGDSVADLANRSGYAYLLIGENLALGNFGDISGIISAWMDSPGHRENILNGEYTELGTVVKTGLYKGENTIIAVQVFGLPRLICAKPDQNTKSMIDGYSSSIKEMQSSASAMLNSLNALKNTPGLNQSYYKQKTQEYNNYAKQINDAVNVLKTIIDSYNLQVNKYNSCVTS